MSILQYNIVGNLWTPITASGESGCCWLDEQNDGAEGVVDVRIWHGSIPTDLELTKAKRVYRPQGNSDLLVIGADDNTDIYYARCSRVDDKATLSVDVA